MIDDEVDPVVVLYSGLYQVERGAEPARLSRVSQNGARIRTLSEGALLGSLGTVFILHIHTYYVHTMNDD
jgi:hypothetical protein